MGEKIWLKRVLIPLWVIQLIVLLIFSAASAFALYVTTSEQLELDNSVKSVLNAGVAVQLSFSVGTILVDIAEIISVARHTLGPVTNIVIQSIKSLVWTVFFVLAIIAAISGSLTGLSFFLIIILFLTCLGQLIYGAVIVHRKRKGTLYRGNYSLAEGGHGGNTARDDRSGSYTAHPTNAPAYPTYSSKDSYSSPNTSTTQAPYRAYMPAEAPGSYGAPQAYEMQGSNSKY
ncbi:hypothetical protein LTR37_016381 [Vermiconidia calcicola]|uniref:Uncharacterized protein n=1 Tax=Vermiconidia calcicola TaxID=1690605 RepID=A0ACC3MPE3_9PEZI|nr:hypothetical protein LTR37_016381 [Vermiconidia calcicola]